MFAVPASSENKKILVEWADRTFDSFCLFNSNGYADKYHAVEWMLAIGKRNSFEAYNDFSWENLQQYYQNSSGLNYGLFNYELKNFVEVLPSAHHSIIPFPICVFHEAEHIIVESHGFIECESLNLSEIIQNYSSVPFSFRSSSIHAYTSKDEYVSNVLKLQEHILNGDIYEVNYCIAYAGSFSGDVSPLYEALNTLSPNPFASLLKLNSKYILSASPERYLAQRDNQIISQPIKGTLMRSGNDELERQQLKENIKERAENVMIVDLVRNDFTRVAKTGTIHVSELFGIYTFPHLHQMISTVEAELRDDCTLINAIRASFPMGSMTGAPKVRAMELIDQYEFVQRGAYSGCIGYFDRKGNLADFNVLIRSIFLDRESGKFHYNVGSAITFDAEPEREYDECLLKASAILKILNQD